MIEFPWPTILIAIYLFCGFWTGMGVLGRFKKDLPVYGTLKFSQVAATVFVLMTICFLMWPLLLLARNKETGFYDDGE